MSVRRYFLTMLALLLLASLLVPEGLLAAHNQDNPWTQSIFFENDLFNGTSFDLGQTRLTPRLPHLCQTCSVTIYREKQGRGFWIADIDGKITTPWSGKGDII